MKPQPLTLFMCNRRNDIKTTMTAGRITTSADASAGAFSTSEELSPNNLCRKEWLELACGIPRKRVLEFLVVKFSLWRKVFKELKPSPKNNPNRSHTTI